MRQKTKTIGTIHILLAQRSYQRLKAQRIHSGTMFAGCTERTFSNLVNTISMKKLEIKKSPIAFFILLVFVLQSCTMISRIEVENDIVYATKRIKWENIYIDHDHRCPLVYVDQTIVKELKPNSNDVLYKVYDILTLSTKSYKLDDKVYIIIDNEVFPMVVDNKEYENSKTFTEKREDVPTSDSTTVSVVTGYSENNQKITRIGYILNSNVIEKLKTSKQVLFRYYAGPNMLTLKLKGYNLKKLKKFINML